jgi:hypothetical protein
VKKGSGFDLKWLRDKLYARGDRGRQLETAVAMLDRWAVIECSLDPMQIELYAPLPKNLANQDHLDIKRQRDHQKLHALLQYVKTKDERKQFIHHYFGLDADG